MTAEVLQFDDHQPERLAWRALGASVACLMVFILAAAAFGMPGVDDWCFGANPLDPVSRANDLYFNWSGRWLGMASLAAVAHSVDLTGNGYRVATTGIAVVCWLAGFTFVAKLVVRSWLKSLLWALLLLGVFWTSVPRPMEVFYWMAGVVVYAPAFALVSASLLLSKKGFAGWATPCAFAASLFNEIAALTALPVLAVMAYRDRRCILPLLAMLGGFAVVALAPGNHERLVSLGRPSIPWVAWSVVRPFWSPVALVADPKLWLLVAAILSLPGDTPKPTRKSLVWPACAVLGVFGSAVATAWAASTTLEPRVLAYMFAVLLAAAFVTAYQLRGIIDSRVAHVGAVAALAIALPTSMNLADIIRVLPESVQSQRNADHYWQALKSQRGMDVAAPSLGEIAFFGAYGPAADPSDKTNICQARYLGLRSIRLLKVQ